MRWPIGELTITNGRAHVVHAPLRADFAVTVETRDIEAARAQIVASARGTYAGAPLVARLTGGSVIAVQDAEHPWPVDLELENGPTRASLRGTLRNPLALAGADLRLTLAGPDMRLLRPLTGVPIPQTPAYEVAGRLAYAERRFRFTGMQGRVGRSDLSGDVTIDPRGERPDITADLHARQLDLADLAGFIGGNPGRNVPIRDDTPSTGRILPNAPVNMPLFQSANIHARYRAARILGEDSPLDNLDVTLELIDGVLTLKPLRGGVGQGAVLVNATFTPQPSGDLHAVGEVSFRRLDISKLMQALGGRGGGALDGLARIDSTGRSTAQLLARGNGVLSLRTSGGNLSALAVDLAGLRLGNAIFSALGIPSRTALECFVAEFGLQAGVLTTRAMLLETSDALIIGTGTIRLDQEQLDMRLVSHAKGVTIGALQTRLGVTGRLSDPSVFPVILPESTRPGLAGVLDTVLAPLGLLPLIEAGPEDDPRCRNLLESTRRRPGPTRQR